MNKEELKQNIMDLHCFTLPLIQHKFNVSYGIARQCVDELLRDDLIRPLNKLKYVVRQRRRRVIPQRELLQNVYSDIERSEKIFMDACIVERFHDMSATMRNELRHILRSDVPEGLPITKTVQSALDVVTYFADNGVRLILRGVQFGQDKFRCIYYAPNKSHDSTVKDMIQVYKRECRGRLHMNVIYKFLSFGLFVLDFPYYETLPSIGKQAAELLIEKKVPRYALSAIRQEHGFGALDFYHSIFRLKDLGVLNELPAPHNSVAYKFAVDAKYFRHLLPDYLWRCKSKRIQKGE